MKRRHFLRNTTLLSMLTWSALCSLSAEERRVAPPVVPTASKLPPWKGFNLLEKFIASVSNAPFLESDFALMAEWGFNFARLPMSYRCWSSPERWRELDEKCLREIDQAVAWGRRYGVHVCLNFHRAPGYSVDSSVSEPFNLWKDSEALEACAYHWAHFAERYRGIPNSALSFDLINEPSTLEPGGGEFLDDATYARVVVALVKAIREKDPERLIIADGLLWGAIPCPALAGLGIAQSTRGYQPFELTHYKAEWVEGTDKYALPSWPLPVRGSAGELAAAMAPLDKAFSGNPIYRRRSAALDQQKTWDASRLREQLILPWQDLEALGVGVHVGEWGAFNKTPHDVTLAWMRDMLACWKQAGWGSALWNFRGPFGILDSERADVRYENFRGHQLDRRMLEVLREG